MLFRSIAFQVSPDAIAFQVMEPLAISDVKTKKRKPTLSDVLREESAVKLPTLRECRQIIRDKQLQGVVVQRFGKSVSNCALDELRQVVGGVA